MEQLVEMVFIEAMRKRPAMYVGSTSIRGFHDSIFEISEPLNPNFYLDEIRNLGLSAQRKNICSYLFCCG
jgi:hypothetical protein